MRTPTLRLNPLLLHTVETRPVCTDGTIVTNLCVMPTLIAGVCFLIFAAQRKTLQTVIAAGAADESAISTLKVKLVHNLCERMLERLFASFPADSDVLPRCACVYSLAVS